MKHKCLDCPTLVYRKEALRCRSCANRVIAKNRDKSYWKSKEFSNLVSTRQKKKLIDPKNHPNYIDGRDLDLVSCKDCNTIISGTSVRGEGRCVKCSSIGYLNPAWDGGKVELTCAECSKTIFKREKAITNDNFCSTKCSGIWMSKNQDSFNNPNWRGGLSNEPYPLSFNKGLKAFIRNRDNCCCQICFKKEIDNNAKLSIHHINYIKENIFPNNLISLCKACHGKTNGNRDYWYILLTIKMREIYENQFAV